jgi:hypothetical protein
VIGKAKAKPQRGKAATKIKPPKSFAEKKELYG